MTTATDITIRNAGVGDAGAVHALIVKMAESVPSHFTLRSSAADFERALAGETPAIRVLLAERGDDAIGLLVFFTTFSTWYGTPGIYVQDIFVDAPARGHGVGHRLLVAVSQWGVQHGADHLRLSVDATNAGAQAFYKDHKLRYCDDERIYMIEGDAFRSLGAHS